MKYLLAVAVMILPRICPANESVEGLLKAANARTNARKSPAISFAEGFTRGVHQGYDEAPYRANQILEIQRQQESLRDIQEQREREAQARDDKAEADRQAVTRAIQAKISMTTLSGFVYNCDAYGEFCDGFLLGSLSMMREASPKGICLPKSIAIRPVITALIHRLDKNPAESETPVVNQLLIVLREDFPCLKKPASQKP